MKCYSLGSKIGVVCGLLLAIQAIGQTTLYDIDFNNQVANELVVTGTPPDHVSSIVFGSPTVVPSVGGLNGQPLRFDMVGNTPNFYYDQVKLGFSRPFWLTTMDVSFDVSSSGLIGSHGLFSVVFDAISVQNIEFRSTGKIALLSLLGGNAGYEYREIGTFEDGEALHFSVHIDAIAHQWSAFKDGVFLAQAPFNPDERIRSIRLSYGLSASDLTPDLSAVGIDNIVVSVPEPAPLGFLGVVLGLAEVIRRGSTERHR